MICAVLETNQFDSAETQLLQEHSIDGSSLSTANNSDSSNSNINLIRQLMLNQLLRRAVRENNCTATNKLLTPGENNVTAELIGKFLVSKKIYHLMMMIVMLTSSYHRAPLRRTTSAAALRRATQRPVPVTETGYTASTTRAR